MKYDIDCALMVLLDNPIPNHPNRYMSKHVMLLTLLLIVLLFYPASACSRHSEKVFGLATTANEQLMASPERDLSCSFTCALLDAHPALFPLSGHFLWSLSCLLIARP